MKKKKGKDRKKVTAWECLTSVCPCRVCQKANPYPTPTESGECGLPACTREINITNPAKMLWICA